MGDVVEIFDALRIPVNAKERASRSGPYPYFGANGQAGTIDDYLFDGEYILLAEDGGYFDDPARGVAYRAGGRFWVNNHAHVVKPTAGMPIGYFVHALNSIDWMPFVSGTTRLKLTQEAMRNVPLPIAPLNEQRRIVAKIEELTDRSRRAREALDAIPALLDRFRQSVLAAAFRGDLTAEWRAKNAGVEPASVLLERIRNRSSLPWESDLDALPTLPDGWSWTTLQEIADIRGGLTKNAKRGELARRMKYLRVANVYAGELRLDDVQEIGVASDAEVERCLLEADDILVVEGNGSPDQIGRVALWDGSVDSCLHQNHIINVRLNAKHMASFVMFWLLSPEGRALIREKAITTTGLYTLSLSKVGSLPVPVAPLEEQKRVVAFFEEALFGWRNLGSLVASTNDRLSAIDQSILAQAFRGELVPQDPNDEPASVLLERIRGERAEAVVPKARRGRKPRELAEARG